MYRLDHGHSHEEINQQCLPPRDRLRSANENHIFLHFELVQEKMTSITRNA